MLAGSTTVLEGPNLRTLSAFGTAIEGGTKPFNSCGAWLMSAYQDPNGGPIKGWYHAETDCDYNVNHLQSHHSFAYAESLDGGLTFSSSEQILTSSTPAQDGKVVGNGGASVLLFKGDFYAYFVDESNPDIWHIGVARSLSADGGKPGTFMKYYQGGFSEPGIGGKSDAIDNVYLASSFKKIDESRIVTIGYSTPGGFIMAISNDAIHYKDLGSRLIYADSNEWYNRANALELYASCFGQALVKRTAQGTLLQHDNSYVRILEYMGRRRAALEAQGRLKDAERTMTHPNLFQPKHFYN